MPTETTARFRRARLMSPKRCAPGSFRTEVPPGAPNVRIVVCCPRGKWDSAAQRCTVGTRGQAILRPRLAAPLVSMFPSRIMQRYDDEVAPKVAEMRKQKAPEDDVVRFVDRSLARIAKEVVPGDRI